jgi:hypothetical protein
MTLRVTVRDLENGDEEVREVPPGEYVIVCAEPCHLAHTSVYPMKGTHVLTVKDWSPRKGDS